MDVEVYRFLAMFVDVAHAGAMVVWGVGMPLLFWHRFPRLSRAYMWFAAAFVAVSVASHLWLGECVLTTLARALWSAAGELRDSVPFTALLVNTVAGIRPGRREAVLLWEPFVLLSSLGSLWCWSRTGSGARTRPRQQTGQG